MYPEYITAPMRAELSESGFNELKTASDVDQFMQQTEGTAMLVINSVCGCAAAGARPGALQALHHAKKPNVSATVFAGVDQEATQKAREYLLPYPPSSPSIAIFKDGKLVHLLERRHIEGRSAELIAQNLTLAFDQYCDA